MTKEWDVWAKIRRHRTRMVARLVLKWYKAGYQDGLAARGEQLPTDEQMIAEFLKNNKVTVIESINHNPEVTGSKRKGGY